MPIPSLPASINVTRWKNVAKDLDKDVNIAPALDKLSKAQPKLDPKAFDLPKLNSAEEAKKALDELDSVTQKSVNAAVAEAKALSKLGSAKLADVKKKKAEVGKILQTIVDDAEAYAKELEASFDAARKALVAAKVALEARDKKAEEESAKKAKKDEEDEKDAESDAMADEKDEKKFNANLKSKMKGFLTAVKTTGAKFSPHEAAVTKSCIVKFRMVSAGKTFGIGISKTGWGDSELKIARRMSGIASGGKDSRGIIHWNRDDQVYVLEGGNVPTGAANSTALANCVKAVIGFRPKFRLQKPGERGEDSDGPAEVDPDEKNAEQADGGGKGAASGGTATVTVPPIIQAAAAEFANARKTFVTEVNKLASALPKFYEQELRSGDKQVARAVLDAKKKLEAAATRIPPDLETTLAAMAKVTQKAQLDAHVAAARRQSKQLQDLCDTDDVLKSLDNNELDGNMAVVKRVQLSIKAIDRVLPA
jgi:hypothetical protein